jgi:uncharacterized tellurite resistance protein B-like protein
MIRRIFETLAVGRPRPQAAEAGGAGALALAALMVRLARADGHYAAEEAARIEAAIGRWAGLAPEDAAGLRARAEALEAGAADAVRFTRVIKAEVPLEQRVALVAALWEVALADGTRDAAEEAELRIFARLLGVSDVESAMARRRAGER